MSQPDSLPTGTATFFFSDIEGSTRLLQQLGDRYTIALTDHNELMRSAFRSHRGRELRLVGDSFFAIFDSALDAVMASAAAQRALSDHEWPDGGHLKVRIGLHTGEATVIADEYVGIDVHRAARIGSAAHGGQILVSGTVFALVENSLPAGMTIRDLGQHRLKDLSRSERLYQLEAAGLETDFPPLRTLDRTPNNLPTQVTSFVGRESEVTEGKRLLQQSRLVTLTGPGGTGKTRLLLQVAADLVDVFPDGVYFVGLSSVRDPTLVPSLIMQTLGLSEVPNQAPVDRLAEHLKQRKVLLALDNFEQLMPAAAAVADLLHRTTSVKVLISSRAPLRVYGEQEFPVPPLGLPEPSTNPSPATLSQYEAVKLFIERAVAVKPDFAVTNENAPAVAAICVRVDGLPLAIELAAARIKLLTPQAMLTRLEKRLGLLSAGARDLPARQQTLRGAISWSYDLLDDPCKRLADRFSVFARGARLEDAEAVCGPRAELGVEVLDGLASLVDQSLLRQIPAEQEPRFSMLHVIREFAQERLGESGEAEELQRRHASTYLGLAERARPELTGRGQKEWLDRLEAENDNLRAALDWSTDAGHTEIASRLVWALWRFWQMRGHLTEGRERITRVLEMPATGQDLTPRLRALEAAGGVAYWQGDMRTAKSFYDDALLIARRLGDKKVIADALYNAFFPATVDKSDLPTGRRLLEESISMFREVDDRPGVTRALWAMGNLLRSLDPPDNPGARAALEESMVGFRKLGDRFGLSWTLHTLGLVDFSLGNVPGARRAWEEALRTFAAAEDISGVILQLDNFSQLARAEGEPERSLRLAGAWAALKAVTGTELSSLVAEREGRLSVEQRPSEQAAAAAWAEGQAMSMEEAVAYALQKS
jgi:predicted ATPase/class 3 adenylate cyclase